MTPDSRIAHGSGAWFDMVGRLMCEAAQAAGLPADLDLSLVERYTDGQPLAPDLVQGIRFDIRAGLPSYRVGAGRDERGDITVEISAAASRALNTLYGADPRFASELERLRHGGEFHIDGDLARLGAWFDAVHDRIVDRTA